MDGAKVVQKGITAKYNNDFCETADGVIAPV